MAELTGKVVSELPDLSAPSNSDLLAVSSGGASKKLTLANLVTFLQTALSTIFTHGGKIFDSGSGSGSVLVQTGTHESAIAQFSFDRDGAMERRISTDGGSTWGQWATIAGTDLISAQSATSSTLTIPANSTGNVNFSVARSGYTPIGIVGITKNGTGTSYCLIYEFRIDGNNAKIYFRNTSASEASFTATAFVLYRRDT